MTAAYGLAAQALLLAWVAWQLTARLPRNPRRIAATGTALLALIPLGDGLSAAMALRALWGDPSVTTLQLLALSLAGRPARIDRRLALMLGACGLAFYPLALGWGDFDPYRIGYAALPVTISLFVAALLAWWRGNPLYLWLLAVDLAVFATGLPESNNLWDILFDPLLMVAALFNGLRRPRQ